METSGGWLGQIIFTAMVAGLFFGAGIKAEKTGLVDDARKWVREKTGL